jgi:large subunit ribosomal protein L22
LPTGAKNPDANMEEAGLWLKRLQLIDGGMMLKRLPSPQECAHRIRKTF